MVIEATSTNSCHGNQYKIQNFQKLYAYTTTDNRDKKYSIALRPL